MPMFPLGTALLPGEPLPLRIFEPRYRQMLTDCLATAEASGDSPRFGVVLIERGSEVGGGETRHRVGTCAEIDVLRRDPSGGGTLTATGTDRFRVIDWLPDDPYPRARVVPLPEPTPTAAEHQEFVELGDRVRELFDRAVRSGMFRIGGPVPDFDDADFAVSGEFGWAARLPIGSADRQRLLEATDVATRFAILAESVDGLDALIRFGS